MVQNKSKEKENRLILIPKTEKYVEYMLQVIFKLPRIEKFSIGTEYKTSMYKTLNYVMYLNKIEENKCMFYINMLDAEINTQRIYLRIMYKNRWLDEKKLNTAMEQIYEIGKIIGGLIKYYGKNLKK